MVERKICSFCGNDIEPGTGKMFIKKDGTVFYFCTGKCQKNMIVLRRVPRESRWTKHFIKIKGEELIEEEKEEKEGVEGEEKEEEEPEEKIEKVEEEEKEEG